MIEVPLNDNDIEHIRITYQEKKFIDFIEPIQFPKFHFTDNLDRKAIFNVGIAHNCVFFSVNNKIFVHIDQISHSHTDKFFLQNFKNFNGYWLYEHEKDIKYNDFTELNTDNIKIKSFSCGYEHIILLSQTGKIYALGNNKCGQLGFVSSPIIYYFKEINIDNVVLVKCGAYHTIIYTKDGLYGAGNNLYGQLGIPDFYLSNVNFFTKICFDSDILDISCGDHHTVILTIAGEIFGFGSNKNGQLGINNNGADIIFPLMINIKNVIDISCGDNHTVINSKNGLYLLGHKNQLITKIPLRNIKYISSGKDYTLVLTDNELVGFTVFDATPIIINIKHITSIKCGLNISVIQTNKNYSHVYTFSNLLENSNVLWDAI